MKKIMLKNKIRISLLLVLFFLPYVTSAMIIEVEKPLNEIKKGDTVMLNVYLDTDETEVNAIEGILKIEGKYEIKTISTAGSIFDLWPNKPSFVEGKISFVGGSTAGVFGSKLKVFSILVEPISSEDLIFNSEQVDVFLNDGLGTKVVAKKLDTHIVVSKLEGTQHTNDLEKLILEDKNPPEEFEIVIGRDSSLFEGKYFASFNTVDNESGINRYEVSENNGPSVRSGNTYVLQDQNMKGEIIVKAIDNAGNVQISQSDKKDILSEDDPINWLPLLISISLLLIIFFMLRLKNKNDKN